MFFKKCQALIWIFKGLYRFNEVHFFEHGLTNQNGNGIDPVPATIVEIQQTADESGDSPMVGQLVITNGIVTAVDDDGFWIQDGEGAWTGLFIREDNPTVAQGNDVSVTGTVHENFGLTRLVDIMDITVNSEGNALPAATVTTTGTAGVEEYESVLIDPTGTGASALRSCAPISISNLSLLTY